MAKKIIGRFEVVRPLGHSAQGEVYLANDPTLGRQVAIKTLLAGASNMQALLQEARAISQLQHKNIVTLFDAGEHEGAPYLVYAYAQGHTLAERLQQEKKLTAAQAVTVMSGVLEGLLYAHQHQRLHLALTPANIMMADNGQPLMMDFGLAASVNAGMLKVADSDACFMAPEVKAGKHATAQADIFAIGQILRTLVTGEATADLASAHAVDAALNEIILKATDAQPEHRYASAEAMLMALQDYLKPALATHHANDTHSTMDFLLRRMRSKSDFPALSTTISEINRVVDDDSANVNLLVQSILQDFALTNKLLKLVNTVTYGQFGGQINTISKAVVILGFETVRNAAMTLILLDFLQNKAQAAQLKEDVLTSFFAGIVAAQFAAEHNIRDAEEAMICSMFRNLGKILASFYFFEESQQIARMVEQAITEDAAATQVLGVTYNELGIGIAKSWNFPLRLIRGMRKLNGDKIPKQYNEIDNLAVTVNLAHELCAIAASQAQLPGKSSALSVLTKRYEHAITLSEQQLRKALETGLTELAARARIIGLDIAGSTLLTRVHVWVGEPSNASKAQTVNSHDAALDGLTQLGEQAMTEASLAQMPSPITPETILTEGIQELTNTLVEEFKLNDVMQMVLETMHRGMAFNRTLFIMRDAKTQQMVARHGFGHDIDALLPKFHFTLGHTPDVFHLAVNEGADLLIADIAAANIASKIPHWYRQLVTTQSFILLPVIVNKKPVGIFYADMEAANSMLVSPKQLSLLRTLRNQLVLAIKQKS